MDWQNEILGEIKKNGPYRKLTHWEFPNLESAEKLIDDYNINDDPISGETLYRRGLLIDDDGHGVCVGSTENDESLEEISHYCSQNLLDSQLYPEDSADQFWSHWENTWMRAFVSSCLAHDYEDFGQITEHLDDLLENYPETMWAFREISDTWLEHFTTTAIEVVTGLRHP